MWVWLIVVSAVAMMVGPVMMLRPTAGQAKLARLRQLAAQKGLTTHMATAHNGDVRAVYGLPWQCENDSNRRGGDIRLTKSLYEHDLHLANVWQLLQGDLEKRPNRGNLEAVLLDCPSGVSDISVSRAGIGCYWDEILNGRSEDVAIDELHQYLKRLRSVCV